MLDTFSTNWAQDDILHGCVAMPPAQCTFHGNLFGLRGVYRNIEFLKLRMISGIIVLKNLRHHGHILPMLGAVSD